MPLYRTVCKNPSAALSEIRSSACFLPVCILAFLACTVSSSALTLGKIASTHSGGTGTCNICQSGVCFFQINCWQAEMYRKIDKHQSSTKRIENLFDILYAFLHFLFAQMYMYDCAHQGSAKEVTPHEGRLLPTTGNSKSL